MRPWLKRTLIGIFGISILAGGMAACSHQRHYGYFGDRTSDAERAEKRARLVDKVSRKLDLDAAQKARLAVLGDTIEAQRQAMKATGGHPQAELQAVLAGNRFDREKAQSLVDAKTTAMRNASPAVIGAAADFYDSLKPEQQQKVRETLDHWTRHRGWRG